MSLGTFWIIVDFMLSQRPVVACGKKTVYYICSCNKSVKSLYFLRAEVQNWLHQDQDYPCEVVGSWNTWYGEQDQAGKQQ